MNKKAIIILSLVVILVLAISLSWFVIGKPMIEERKLRESIDELIEIIDSQEDVTIYLNTEKFEEVNKVDAVVFFDKAEDVELTSDHTIVVFILSESDNLEEIVRVVQNWTSQEDHDVSVLLFGDLTSSQLDPLFEEKPYFDRVRSDVLIVNNHLNSAPTITSARTEDLVYQIVILNNLKEVIDGRGKSLLDYAGSILN